MASLDDLYGRAHRSAFSKKARRNRFDALLNNKQYNLVGFYPAGGYTAKILQMYAEFFGEPKFKTVLFDSNPNFWGKSGPRGIPVHSPQDIMAVKPQVIIVSNYNYSDEIYNSLAQYQTNGIEMIRLHKDSDVPWNF